MSTVIDPTLPAQTPFAEEVLPPEIQASNDDTKGSTEEDGFEDFDEEDFDDDFDDDFEEEIEGEYELMDDECGHFDANPNPNAPPQAAGE